MNVYVPFVSMKVMFFCEFSCPDTPVPFTYHVVPGLRADSVNVDFYAALYVLPIIDIDPERSFATYMYLFSGS